MPFEKMAHIRKKNPISVIFFNNHSHLATQLLEPWKSTRCYYPVSILFDFSV